MTDIERVQSYLKESLDISTTIMDNGEALHGCNDRIVALVVAPHEGNEYHWVLRLSPIVSFDRWANSMCIEEYLNSPEDIHWYLYECETDIYYKLFDCLSQVIKAARAIYPESSSRDMNI